jgi:hypothetical protein
MTSKLTQQKRSVMNEYAMQVAALMGFPKDFSWIADINETSSLDALEIGEGAYYLGWTDLQVIIDKLDVWIEKYGSREAVAERITAWNDWWLNDYFEHNDGATVAIWESKAQRFLRTCPRINLEAWLMGAPVTPYEENVYDRKRRMTVEREMMMHYIDEFGGYTQLRDLLYQIEDQLAKASEDVEQLNEQAQLEFLNSENGKKCIDTLTEAIENETKF